jgi:uncharacterized protein YukE
MGDLRGADLEAMDALASLLDSRSQQLSNLRSTITGQISQLPRLWQGRDAGQFVQRWTTEHGPALGAAVRALADASDTITRNRHAQDQTSATLGGATVGAGGTGSPGEKVQDGGRFGFVGDAWNWTSDTATDTWNWTGDTARRAWDTAEPVVSEGGHRLSEYGEYQVARGERRLRNPVQTAIDDLTLTGPLEFVVATDLILRGGGEFDGSIGAGQFEAITDVDPYGAGGITLGHTVGFAQLTPRPDLVDHELQHVYDIESVGGLNFYLSYLANWGVNIARGQDSSLLGEAYRNIYWEQRGYAVEERRANVERLDFDLNPLRWFD